MTGDVRSVGIGGRGYARPPIARRVSNPWKSLTDEQLLCVHSALTRLIGPAARHTVANPRTWRAGETEEKTKSAVDWAASAVDDAKLKTLFDLGHGLDAELERRACTGAFLDEDGARAFENMSAFAAAIGASLKGKPAA